MSCQPESTPAAAAAAAACNLITIVVLFINIFGICRRGYVEELVTLLECEQLLSWNTS